MRCGLVAAEREIAEECNQQKRAEALPSHMLRILEPPDAANKPRHDIQRIVGRARVIAAQRTSADNSATAPESTPPPLRAEKKRTTRSRTRHQCRRRA